MKESNTNISPKRTRERLEPLYIVTSCNEIKMKYTQQWFMSTIKIKNIYQDSAILLRLKTNAPENYCVRPSAYSLNPGEAIEVIIYLRYSNKFKDKVRDKFQIQALPSNEFVNKFPKPEIKSIIDIYDRLQSSYENRIQTLILPVNIEYDQKIEEQIKKYSIVMNGDKSNSGISKSNSSRINAEIINNNGYHVDMKPRIVAESQEYDIRKGSNPLVINHTMNNPIVQVDELKGSIPQRRYNPDEKAGLKSSLPLSSRSRSPMRFTRSQEKNQREANSSKLTVIDQRNEMMMHSEQGYYYSRSGVGGGGINGASGISNNNNNGIMDNQSYESESNNKANGYSSLEKHYAERLSDLKKKSEKYQKKIKELKVERDKSLNQLKKIQFTLDQRIVTPKGLEKEIIQ